MRPLALTMGEPAGIGGEIALTAWRRRREGIPPFVAIDDPARLAAIAAALGWEAPVRAVAGPADAMAAWDQALPVLAAALPGSSAPGKPDPANAPAVIAAIERSVALTLAGETSGVVTLPIQKETLYRAGFRHPGHTEFLAELAGAGTPVMMLACPGLRVVPVTVHMPLAAALSQLSTAGIVKAGRITAAALAADFGIARPRLAVASVNPHAGENGRLGREEIDIVAPAVAALRADGIEVFGPAPADTLFHPRARARYDAALCMYHDQALIPLKTIDFERGVNVTLGLPFVRTSPDHGTALDIAGKGVASAESLIAALKMAAEMAAARSAAGTPR
jgi:4-hydroxythreonine-4-phosphate dehydrogenase